MMKKLVYLFYAAVIAMTFCSCAPVVIETTPPGASVYDDSETLLGTTPYKTDMFLSSREYTVKKEGYIEESVTVNFDAPPQINLRLRQKSVIIYSKPTAEIYPAGSDASIGRTPKEILMSEETKTYTLKLAGYYDQEVAVGLESESLIVADLVIRPIVTISASPDGVEVYENNKLIGTAPVKEEIASSRTFEFKKSGYFTKTLTLKGAPPYTASVELEAFPVITIDTTPKDAEIYCDGKLLQKKAPVQLAVGKKVSMEARAPRYYSQKIDVTPESAKQVRIDLKAMPYVMIKSQPSGAQVFIKGTLVGVTPIEQLIEKETQIELKNDGYISKTEVLTGKDKAVDISLEKIPPPPPPVVANTNLTESSDSELVEDVVPAKKETADESVSGKGILFAIIGATVLAVVVFFVMKRKS